MLKKIRLLTNPVAVFVEDCCVIAADARVRKDDLLTTFRSWAGRLNEGLAWTTEEQFGVWLKSATKRRVDTIRPRTGPDGKQELWYAGIRLSDQSAEDGVDPF
jgi:hypothetical protein